MPLVSRMLLARRGTRGKPCLPSVPGTLRPPDAAELLRRFADFLECLPIERPELGLPLLSRDFAPKLLDPKAGQRADLPAIAPAAAIAILLEMQRLRRIDCRGWIALDDSLEDIATHVHFAMTRNLCAHAAAERPCALVEPNLEPRRWLSGALCHVSPIAAVLLDALRSAILLELERELREPVVRTDSPAQHQAIVEMLGCVRYVHDRAAHRTVAKLHVEGVDLRPNRLQAASLLEPPSPGLWVHRYVLRHWPLLRSVAAAVDLGHLSEPPHPRTVASWLAYSLQAQLRRCGAGRILRRALREAAPLAPGTIEIAWRTHLDHGGPPTCVELDHIEAHLDRYREIQRLNPRLLHLAAAASRAASDAAPCDLQQLKQLLRTRGASHNAWRLLCRHGVRAYAPAMRELRYRRDPLACIVELANHLVACQRPGLPPPELVQHLVAVCHQNPDQAAALGPPELLRAAWDATRGMDRPARRAFVRESFSRVLAWRYETRSTTPIPAAASWHWFDRHAARWDARMRVARAASASWPGLVEAFEHDGIHVLPLDTPLALWDEASAMRHCLTRCTYPALCRAGLLRIFSLREARTGRPLATLALQRDVTQAWQCRELSGFTNRVVRRQDVLAAARATQARLVAASEQASEHAGAEAPPELWRAG